MSVEIMLFSPKVILHALLYGILMAVMIAEPGYDLYIIGLLLLNVYWSRRLLRGGFLCTLPSSLFVIITAGLLYYIDSNIQRYVFISLAVFVYFVFLLGNWRLRQQQTDETARSAVAMCLISLFFIFFATGNATHINFAIPLWVYLPLFFLVGVYLSFFYFSLIPGNNNRYALLYAFFLGVFSMEVAWLATYWPFSYLTSGIVILIFYYIIWDMAQSHLLGQLTRRRVLTNMTLMLFLVGLVLSTSRWLI